MKVLLRLFSKSDVAAHLGVSVKYLDFILKKHRAYSVFYIPKKKGGRREIAAPKPQLLELQQKLLTLLENYYKHRSPVHGFVKHRSILSNAKPHAASRFVLNVDLKDFFPSIHFGRIRGLLMGKPYYFGEQAARIIANLCCRDKVLPQGAPTSPILANMICAKLDSQLKALAKTFHCQYTRYADDLTFSTRKSKFPAAIAVLPPEGAGAVSLGPELQAIITGNGFTVNEDKIKVWTRQQRQEVTGLTVNRIPNVQRRFVKQIRAMLHAWKKFGLEKCQSTFREKYDRRVRSSSPPFQSVVRGKIEFVGSIRGKADPLYWRLLRQYAKLDTAHPLKEPPDFVEYDIEELKKAIWIIRDKSTDAQGTAFCLKDIGYVTCDHAIEDKDQIYLVCGSDPLETEYKASVLYRSQKYDLAILSIDYPPPKELTIGDFEIVKQGDVVRLLGFPQHHTAADVSIYEANIVHEFTFERQKRWHIDAPIIQGNSGGPLLNSDNRVIGVAIKGQGSGDNLNVVVPIGYIYRLKVEAEAEAAKKSDVAAASQ